MAFAREGDVPDTLEVGPCAGEGVVAPGVVVVVLAVCAAESGLAGLILALLVLECQSWGWGEMEGRGREGRAYKKSLSA